MLGVVGMIRLLFCQGSMWGWTLNFKQQLLLIGSKIYEKEMYLFGNLALHEKFGFLRLYIPKKNYLKLFKIVNYKDKHFDPIRSFPLVVLPLFICFTRALGC